MGKLLYQLFARLYPFVIRIAAPFNTKANLWIKGRVGVYEQMKKSIGPNDRVIWMHCSSLGEFEQGRPVLERLKEGFPSFKMLLTFFSPSGYEVRKNYNGADYIYYLPMDGKQNVKLFYDIVHPVLILFVKYEFWYFYLIEAKKRQIPLLLISAIFRPNQPFFRANAGFYRDMLSSFTHLFVQNTVSVELLRTIGFKDNVSLSGDTRFDRVIEIAESFEPISLIQKFCGDAKVIVAGSTWLEDDKELAHYTNSREEVKFIIAPHNIGKERLNECLRIYKNATLFSLLQLSGADAGINTIIIDNVGMLSRLYNYGTLCYIGGGFGTDGVHNVLEAAVYGRPVLFGPEYQKFVEAIELIECGGARSIKNALQLEAAFDQLLDNEASYEPMSQASRSYVYSKRGSTDKIISFIQENRLLTN